MRLLSLGLVGVLALAGLTSCASSPDRPTAVTPASARKATRPPVPPAAKADPDSGDAQFAWDPREEKAEQVRQAEQEAEARAGGKNGESDEDAPADAEAGADAGAQEEIAEAEEVEADESAEPVVTPEEDLAQTEPELTPEEILKERQLVESDEPEFDIPMSLNEKVLGWVDFYSNRHRERFLPGLVRSGRYLPMIRRIFKEEGIPLDLAYIAHVESAYKPNALSRSRAKGIFQFMSATGRQYGLRADYWIDERSDPEKATRAAAHYLRNLYAMFGDWHLAMAAYNAGEGRISRAMAATGADDFWSLALTRHIHTETKNYVPAILAATLISKNPAKYGFEFEPDPPFEYETIDVKGAVDLNVLARCAASDVETIKTLNPALRRMQTPPDRTTHVRVPVGRAETTLTALAALPPSQRVLFARHTVRRGESLSALARRYGTTVSSIQRTNRMGRRTVLRVGQTLRIPSSSSAVLVAESEGGSAPASSPRKSGAAMSYKVRRGDTLTAIARRHDTSVAALASVNGFSSRRVLRAGERIKIVPGARSVAAVAKHTKSQSKTASKTVHTVRSGDTLWGIATRYRISIAELCDLNNISVRSPLHVGTRLTVRQ